VPGAPAFTRKAGGRVVSDDVVEGERTFGPYRLLRRIAVGGMAEIHLAKARGVGGFEKLIALKMIHAHYSTDEHFVQMLIDEAKISVQLAHVNIGQIFDLGRIGETYYITMEFIDGADLFKILRRASEIDRDMPIEVATFIAQEVCAGLDYAHNKRDEEGRPLGVIHRDISPQNILVSFAGEVKIVDFGIAKAALRVRQTAAGVIKGKYYYMSPEQAWGDPVDARTDVFSAGILLYEMLTGQMLYLEDDLHRLLDRVRRADIPPPSTRRPNIPRELEPIVMRALRKRPEDRWQSAHDFQQALQKFLFTSAREFSPQRLAAYIKEVLREEVSVAEPVPAAVPRLASVEELPPDEHSVIFRLQDLARAAQAARGPAAPPARPFDDSGDGDTILNSMPPVSAFPTGDVTAPHAGLVGGARSGPTTAVTAKHRPAPAPPDDFGDDADPTVIDSGVRIFAAGAPAPRAAGRPRLPGVDQVDEEDTGEATVALRPPRGPGNAARPATPARPSTDRKPTVRPGEHDPTVRPGAPPPRPAASRSPMVSGAIGGREPPRPTTLPPGLADLDANRQSASDLDVTRRRSVPRAGELDATRREPPPAVNLDPTLRSPPPAVAAAPRPAVSDDSDDSDTLDRRPSRPRTPVVPGAAPPFAPPPPAGLPVLGPGGVVVPSALAAPRPGADPWGTPPPATDWSSPVPPAGPGGGLNVPFFVNLDGSPGASPPALSAPLEFDLSGGPVLATPPPPRPRRPTRWVVPAVVGAVVLLVAALAILFVAWPREAPFGSIEVASVPSGAQVSFDDSATTKTTPVVIPSVARQTPHKVVVALSGYEAWQRQVSFEPKQESLQVIAVLMPIVGVVAVETDPPGALVLLDDRPQGTSPRRVEGLPVNAPVRVKAQLAGYRAVEKTYEWQGQKLIAVKLKLEPETDERPRPHRGR
jgi:eukaryotic-like serine/threonine-protein kinase